MAKAKDIMETNIISINPDTEIPKAVKILLNNHINGVPVVNNKEELVGILCQSDLIFQQKDIPIPPIFAILDSIIPLSSSQKLEDSLKKIAATTVEQAMVKDPVTVGADTPVSEIATLMVEKHFHTIPVVEGKKVVGIIGKEDILKTLIPKD
ncbi:MAG: CBS domain-containing protein [Desulfobacteraceae bacterium]|nr:CBS domain-containing protein [Desulfobacteraceae bacterium]